MNAIARPPPRQTVPTPEIAADEAEHARMARNRASQNPPPMREPLSASDPLDMPAFRMARLLRAVSDARATLAWTKRNAPLRGTPEAKREGKRAVSAASRALAAAEAAVVAEERGEGVAPAVQREAVGGAVTIREARIEAAPGRRPELMGQLERMKAYNVLEPRLYRALREYRHAWELAGRDAYPIGGASGEGGRSAPQSGNRRVEQAVGCAIKLDGARRCIGTFATVLIEHIVVHDFTIAAWAVRQKMSDMHAKGMLILVAERLAEHWNAERERGMSLADVKEVLGEK